MKDDIKSTGAKLLEEVKSKNNDRKAVEKAIKQNKAFKFFAYAILFTVIGTALGIHLGVSIEKYLNNERTQAVETAQTSLKEQTPLE